MESSVDVPFSFLSPLFPAYFFWGGGDLFCVIGPVVNCGEHRVFLGAVARQERVAAAIAGLEERLKGKLELIDG